MELSRLESVKRKVNKLYENEKNKKKPFKKASSHVESELECNPVEASAS